MDIMIYDSTGSLQAEIDISVSKLLGLEKNFGSGFGKEEIK